jgi:hypothetical protein
MVVRRLADHAEVENQLGASVGMTVKELANWSAGLTRLADERLELSSKDLLCESVLVDHFQIRAQWAIEGGGDDWPICHVR